MADTLHLPLHLLRAAFVGLAALIGACLSVHAAQAAPAALLSTAAATARPTADARALLRWILSLRDHEGLAFAVIDKRQARLWLFDAQGALLGDTPVLLGLARGDASVQGIGERPLEQVRPEERTTPAGRFLAQPGHNAAGEDIFWIDYDAAVSMHRVRATNPAERRLQRLATPSAKDNRVSYGCINVPAQFYERHLQPAFQRRGGVVYVLPETMPLSALFTPAPAPARGSLGRL